jgi:formamidopyrimidine-DNA glycosylase
MPELPEVETIKRGLAASIPHHTIKSALLSPLAHSLRLTPSPHSKQKLENQQFDKKSLFSRRGKYLLLPLKNKTILCIHLGMSGKIITSETPPQTSPHNHLILALVHQNKKLWMTYHDPRRFGFFQILSPEHPSLPALDNLGEEPFSITPDRLLSLLHPRKIPIKNALLNQKIIAGIGNIYASEALFSASIHPLSPSSSLSLQDCEKLILSLQNVLSLAIKSGGSSLRDHRKSDGSLGMFQHQWNVYNREGKPCPLCKLPHIIHRASLSGRSSFFCPHHQKKLSLPSPPLARP